MHQTTLNCRKWSISIIQWIVICVPSNPSVDKEAGFKDEHVDGFLYSFDITTTDRVAPTVNRDAKARVCRKTRNKTSDRRQEMSIVLKTVRFCIQV